ncbi:NAD(P)-binding protein [Poronia punctata]|nr:NAD(P)-binding protein [Poronia punctata]
MPKIAIVGGLSGKLGKSTISALLEHDLVPPSEIIALTSSLSPPSPPPSSSIEVRHARFEDAESFGNALKGVYTLFLISTPDIKLDFGVEMDYDGTDGGNYREGRGRGGGRGRGRESHHRNAIDAAVKAGVKWIVYSSLAFAFSGGVGNVSKAGVMRAHLRTEEYLRSLHAKGKINYTILREGLYNESWPLYLGYFDLEKDRDEREIVPLAGDGKVCWTGIRDLGIASAVVLSSPGREEFFGKTFYLSTRPEYAKTVGEIARIVGEARGGKGLEVRKVGREEHVRYYVEERGKERDAVEWWVSSYEALEDGECLVDDGMLEELLRRVGVKAVGVEETVRAMVGGK